MWVRVGMASGLRLWFRSSFKTMGVTLKADFVRVGWIWVLFLLEFALGQMVTGLGFGVGVEGDDVRGRQRKG